MSTFRNLSSGVVVSVADSKDARFSAGWEPVTGSQPAGMDEPTEFDPSGHTVGDVTEYLQSADETERARVLASEVDGKARKSLADWQPVES